MRVNAGFTADANMRGNSCFTAGANSRISKPGTSFAIAHPGRLFALPLIALALAALTPLDAVRAQSTLVAQAESEDTGQTPASSANGTGGEGQFRIVDASTSLVEGVHQLDADLDLQFSTDAEEAIENGVPMSIVIEMEVVRERVIWDEVIATPGTQFRVENHPLTTLYVIRDVDTGVARTFRTRADMMTALGAVRGLEVVPDTRLDPAERYRLRVRVRLDIEALPAPLRPLAYLSSTWRLRSEWHTQSLRAVGAPSRNPSPFTPQSEPTVETPDTERSSAADQ